MIIVVQREYTEDIVIFVNGFAKVTTFLLVPPIGVWITLGARYSGRVDPSTLSKLDFIRLKSNCFHSLDLDLHTLTIPSC